MELWKKTKNDKVFDTIIKLPKDDAGNPDWLFMKEYVKSIWGGSHKTSILSSKIDFDVSSWKEFTIDELFDVKYGINMELSKCDEKQGGINFVARTSQNNGVSSQVEFVTGKKPQEAGLITCAGGGSVLSTFLQDKPFYSGRDLYLLRSKDNISKAAKLFIITIIKKNQYKYSYGRQANVTMPKIVLKLPATDEGKPDYKYMESFINKLPYSDKI